MRRTERRQWFPTPGRAVTAASLPALSRRAWPDARERYGPRDVANVRGPGGEGVARRVARGGRARRHVRQS